MRAFFSRQFAAFLVTGGIAALVNFGTRILYNHWLGFTTAVVLAYLTGMVTAFVLARIFVFRGSQQPMHRSALYFTLVNVVAAAQTLAVSLLLLYWVFPRIGMHLHPRELAHAVGIVIPVFTSYLGHKHFSFR